MGNKFTKKITPVSVYDVEGMESWLGDMSAEGLHLKKANGLWAKFERGEPKKVSYRLEPGIKPDNETLKGYELLGWHDVCRLGKFFTVYKNLEEAPQELPVNIESQIKGFDLVQGEIIKSLIYQIFINLMYILMLGNDYLFEDEVILYEVTRGNFFMLLTFITLLILMSIELTLDLKRINKYLKKIKLGQPLSHKKDYKRVKRIKLIGYSIWITLLGIMIISVFYQDTQSWRKNIGEVHRPLPTIRLEKIEGNSHFEYYSEVSDDKKDWDNYVTQNSTFLAPTQYKIYQTGIIRDKKWESSNQTYTPSLETYYYKLSFKSLAEPLLNDLIRDHIGDEEDLCSTELNTDVFDKAVVVKENNTQYLFAYKDKKVIAVRYHGAGNLVSKINEIAEALKND